MKLVTVENLTLGYDGKPVVENLSFSIDQGDYLCIVGENGSGKSTLIKALLHLNPPLHGHIIEHNTFSHTKIGYLPQQTQLQRDFPASVREIVLSGQSGHMGLRPFYKKEEKETALKNMEKLGIQDLADRCYRELSGGQQQRVLLARALCATENMLLLDEPVAGLDPKVTQEMYELIWHLNHDDGITVVMVSHDITAATHYASHILHISSSHHFFGMTELYQKSEEGIRFVSKTEEDDGDGC